MSSLTSNWLSDLYCVTCHAQLIASGRACPTCQTPLQVSKSFRNQGYGGKLVSVLGASSAGKTVYLGMLLDMLSKGYDGIRGIPNGSFSMEIQDETIRAFENRRFPEKTPSEVDKWNWVHCEAFDERKPKRRVEIITPDVAGEVLALELEHPNSSTTVRSLITNSDGMIILLDSQQVRDDARTVDVFGTKLAAYIADLHTRQINERRKKVRLPIAFVLTKSDGCREAAEDVDSFVKTNLPGLTQYCEQKMWACDFFSASVVGSTMSVIDAQGIEYQAPLHIQPRGIVEPLEWVLSQLEKKWRRSK